MTEYITKEQAIGVVEEAIGNIINSDSESVNLTDLEIEIQMTITDYTDAADVAPVVHATTTDAGWDEIYCQWKTCNKCQGDNVSTAIYCNWCGARMDGGESNEP